MVKYFFLSKKKKKKEGIYIRTRTQKGTIANRIVRNESCCIMGREQSTRFFCCVFLATFFMTMDQQQQQQSKPCLMERWSYRLPVWRQKGGKKRSRSFYPEKMASMAVGSRRWIWLYVNRCFVGRLVGAATLVNWNTVGTDAYWISIRSPTQYFHSW